MRTHCVTNCCNGPNTIRRGAFSSRTAIRSKRTPRGRCASWRDRSEQEGRAGTAELRLPRASRVLNERHDIAFGVLEPGRLRAAGGNDAARTLLAGHVVILEFHTAALQVRHLALDVVDVPER